MNNEIVLTPEELYYLGKLFQAKYIDYSYIAAMKDVSENYSVFEKETQAALVSSGVLMEDFSGNIEIDARLTEVLNPVFFGEFESCIDDCVFGEELSFNVYKFHFHDDTITMVTYDNDKFNLKKIDLFEVEDIVSKILSNDYSCDDKEIVDFVCENPSRMIIFKNITVGKVAHGVVFVEQNGKFYREIQNKGTFSVSRETYETLAYSIIKGA